MNISDGNYIGYLLATIHTLDIFSTSESATGSYCYHKHKLAKNTEGVGGQIIGDWFELALNILVHMPLSSTLTQNFFISLSSTQ
jgi:hypothetical protein